MQPPSPPSPPPLPPQAVHYLQSAPSTEHKPFPSPTLTLRLSLSLGPTIHCDTYVLSPETAAAGLLLARLQPLPTVPSSPSSPPHPCLPFIFHAESRAVALRHPAHGVLVLLQGRSPAAAKKLLHGPHLHALASNNLHKLSSFARSRPLPTFSDVLSDLSDESDSLSLPEEAVEEDVGTAEEGLLLQERQEANILLQDVEDAVEGRYFGNVPGLGPLRLCILPVDPARG